jgi:hypothetical protein
MVEHYVYGNKRKLYGNQSCQQESASPAIGGKEIWMRQSPYDLER